MGIQHSGVGAAGVESLSHSCASGNPDASSSGSEGSLFVESCVNGCQTCPKGVDSYFLLTWRLAVAVRVRFPLAPRMVKG